MTNPAINVKDIAKRYRLGASKARYRTLRDQIMSAAATPFRRLREVAAGGSAVLRGEEIWALRGVSFEIDPGEVVGIVGRNGAGKTTLLKVLSRITEPTRGEAEIRGRVSSLLEVGTGFHPELTGRENVYLNGAILGMGRREIERKFDAIVAFAEVERFIDTQVKHFSSGMQVRLAFAIAAHLDPEVLLVDEVLAVGDAGFQRKCLASIRETTRDGRTALVVSHNMAMVRALCERVILLDSGQVVADGETETVLARYHETFRTLESEYTGEPGATSRRASLSGARLLGADGTRCSEIPCGESFSVEIDVHVEEGAEIRRPWIGVRLHGWHGDLVAHVANREAGYELDPLSGTTSIRCRIERANLLPGEYYVGVVIADAHGHEYHRVEPALSFTVLPADVFRSGILPSSRHGTVFLESVWSARPRASRERFDRTLRSVVDGR